MREDVRGCLMWEDGRGFKKTGFLWGCSSVLPGRAGFYGSPCSHWDGMASPQNKNDSGFCWLQGCELTTVMPGGSALWISKFAFFLRMFSISLPFFRNCCDHPGQKKIHKGFGQAWSLCIKGSHRRSGRLPVPLDTLWAGAGFESLLLEHLRVLFSCSVRKDIVNNLENQVCSPDS